MNKLSSLLLMVVIAVVASYGTMRFVDRGILPTAQTAAKESAYDRVMRTQAIRCGYIVYPPETIKDPNTGKLSGTIVDTMEEVGRQLGLKIEWTAEVGFQDMFEGLKNGKYDALCAGLYENPDRAKAALFSVPFNYGATYALVRAEDKRFDASLDAINDPDVKVAQIDGEMGQFIVRESFPKAGQYLLPTLSDISMELEALATRKADVVFMQVGPARGYMQNNPDKIKVLRKVPARAFPAPLMAFAREEHDLKFIVDATLRALHENGFVERTLRKYDPNLDSYKLVAKPYAE
ncbi:MAG: transporter substrate-binding domain-containing protein [Bdellovibrionales bacterium]